jgi:acetyltransferase-like isoleucine patch superfamily enzyme/acyl carrier protein
MPFRRRAGAAETIRAAASSCGVGLQVRGRPIVRNAGRLVVGNDVVISASPAVTHLVAERGGTLRIGDRVEVGHGGAISCHHEVVVGDDVVIAPFVAIMDFDFHGVGGAAAPAPRPVTIERGARLGAWVVVLPGSHVGAGAMVAAGSVVAGSIAPGARVAGNPAMAPSAVSPATVAVPDAALLVQQVFRLDARPAPSEGRHSIPGWDSLGSLELLMQLEAALGTPLDDADVACLMTVEDVDRLIAQQSSGRAQSRDDRAHSVAAVVARVFGLDALPPPTARCEDVPGWDSLGTLELVLALEASFGISVDERRLGQVNTVGDLESLVG